MIWHEKYSDYLPLPEAYDYVMRQIDWKRYPKDQQAKAKYMRKEILGNDWIGYSPDVFWDINMLLERNIKPSEWRNPKIYSQLDRAKIRAVEFINSMKYVVEKYNDYQQDQKDKIKNKTGQDKKKGKPW